MHKECENSINMEYFVHFQAIQVKDVQAIQVNNSHGIDNIMFLILYVILTSLYILISKNQALQILPAPCLLLLFNS